MLMLRFTILVWALTPVGLCSGFRPQEIPEALTARKPIPPEHHADALLTVNRCSTCHAFSRVSRARHTGDDWEPVVFSMQEKPKANISPVEAAKISAFLAWWSTETSVLTPSPTPSDSGTGRPPSVRRSVQRRSTFSVDDVPLDQLLGEDLNLHVRGAKVEGLDPAAGIEVVGDSALGTFIVALRQSPEGSVERRSHVLRRWTIGPFPFEQSVQVERAWIAEGKTLIELVLVVEQHPRTDRPPEVRAPTPAPHPPAPVSPSTAPPATGCPVIH